MSEPSFGKAQPFRTSGGAAAHLTTSVTEPGAVATGSSSQLESHRLVTVPAFVIRRGSAAAHCGKASAFRSNS